MQPWWEEESCKPAQRVGCLIRCSSFLNQKIWYLSQGEIEGLPTINLMTSIPMEVTIREENWLQ